MGRKSAKNHQKVQKRHIVFHLQFIRFQRFSNGHQPVNRTPVKINVDLASISFDHVRFTKETSTRFDRTLEKPVSRLCSSGVFVPRVYEGEPSNNAGFTVQYGWGGEVTEFSICWRDVELDGRRKVPTRNEIEKQILAGDATVTMDSAQGANKLIIKKISVLYREAEPFKKADIVEPVILIKADAVASGATADCTIYLKLQ